MKETKQTKNRILLIVFAILIIAVLIFTLAKTGILTKEGVSFSPKKIAKTVKLTEIEKKKVAESMEKYYKNNPTGTDPRPLYKLLQELPKEKSNVVCNEMPEYERDKCWWLLAEAQKDLTICGKIKYVEARRECKLELPYLEIG